MNAKMKKTTINLGSRQISVYASPRLSSAVSGLLSEMSLFAGVKFSQVLELVYRQGEKDGASKAFSAVAQKVTEAELEVPHRNPGKPKGSTARRRIVRAGSKLNQPI